MLIYAAFDDKILFIDYSVSDIHGHYDLFCRLADKIKFSFLDRLFVLGDIIDKGDSSIRRTKLLSR